MIGVHRLYRCDNQKHVVWTKTSGYCNPKLDAVMAKAAVETDFVKRKAFYAKFQQILTADIPLIWIHESPYQSIYNKELHNVITRIWPMTPMDKVDWKDGHAPNK